MTGESRSMKAGRRRVLVSAGAGAILAASSRHVAAQTAPAGAPATGELADAIKAFTGGAPVRPGKVRLEIAQLVDNGNTVPVTVSVDGSMQVSDRPVAIGVFNERNPQRDVAIFQFGPRAAKAMASTRIRLATSQKLVAVARLADGSHWSHTVDVVVTLAACIEGETS